MKRLSSTNSTVIAIFGVLFISISLFFTIFYRFEQDRLEQTKQQYYLEIQNAFQKSVQKHLKQHYKETLKGFISEAILRAVANGEREKLLTLTELPYQKLKESDKYFHILHYHLAEGNTLLRLHHKEFYGDDIAASRPLLAIAHKNTQTIFGFDKGIHGFMYRIIEPLFYEGEYIGAVEIGASPQKVLDLVTYFNNVDGIIKFYEEGKDSVAYAHVENKKLINLYPKNTNLPKNLEMQVEDRFYNLYSFDISNYKGDFVGEFIFFDDISQYHGRFNDTVTNMMILSITSFIVLFLLFAYFLKNHSQKLSHLHKRSNAILNAQNDIVIVTNGKEIIEVNKAFLLFTGF
ncbi:MAG: cache domain-containing protein, partial [Campylobacterota bacterium]